MHSMTDGSAKSRSATTSGSAKALSFVAASRLATALVSVITLNDLLRQTQVAVSSTRQPFFFYLVACLIYLGLSLLSSIAIGQTRRWASRGMVTR